MYKNLLLELQKVGQSLWYDNIERSKLMDGSIEQMIQEGKISGITSNPSIFQKAIATSNAYDNTLKPMAWSGLGREDIFWQLAMEDIRQAANLFFPLYEKTQMTDGYVSLEVNPLFAYDTPQTIADARRLWERVDKPNLMIKIPATSEGLPAIRQAIASGINVNVTLIFSIKRYAEVIEAYMAGLEDRVLRGEPIHHIASVASFFISRIDTKIDALLQAQSNAGMISDSTYLRLAGKAAIANATMAYQLFSEKFNSMRFAKLASLGAQLQRPLWASTSTKNPEYRDVLYLEELVAPQSVNTVPPATLDAFFDHGKVGLTIDKNHTDANRVLTDLASQGIILEQVTGELEKEGVEAFSQAYEALLDAVEVRQIHALEEIGDIKDGVVEGITTLNEINFSRRMAAKDPTLWTQDPNGQAEIKKRMDWLEAPYQSLEEIDEYCRLTEELLAEGFTDAVLIGMGGSSLAPEVFRNILGRQETGLLLTIMDSTDPQQISAVVENTPERHTVYIVASKSGTTGEINALFDFFWKRTIDSGTDKPGNQFIAITDPKTALAELAAARGFRRLFEANPNVGGRNSALTAFGLVTAAIIGADLRALLNFAILTAELCSTDQPVEANPGIVLGTILAVAAQAGKDKVTLLAEDEWVSFGDWLEQLLAESSGKDGQGMLPVTNEPEFNPEEYSKDRLFVYFDKTNAKNEFINCLVKAGHPCVSIKIKNKNEIAGQFYLWEIAVATACSILGVNSFDQPDVQDAKLRTLAGLEAYRKNGMLPVFKPTADLNGIRVLSGSTGENEKATSLMELILNCIEDKSPIEYIAINAFLPKNSENEKVIQQLREKIGAVSKMPVTVGFGPRYLHSTGQFHKGGPNTGLFILITSQRSNDLDIPGLGVSFGVMQRAQAIGDYQALMAKGRKVLWLDLDEPDLAVLLDK